jgi:hypothetical protein
MLLSLITYCGGGTKSGEPAFVTFATKWTMDLFAGPSLHEGSASAPRAH